MSGFVLDTDHLSLYQVGNPTVLRNVALNVHHPLALTVVTIEEQFTGWQRALRQARDNARREHVYRRLAAMTQGMCGWVVLPFSISAMNRHEDLVRAKLNVGSYDLKIAAIALEYQATLVTRNTRDFARILGLTLVDWSA